MTVNDGDPSASISLPPWHAGCYAASKSSFLKLAHYPRTGALTTQRRTVVVVGRLTPADHVAFDQAAETLRLPNAAELDQEGVSGVRGLPPDTTSTGRAAPPSETISEISRNTLRERGYELLLDTHGGKRERPNFFEWVATRRAGNNPRGDFVRDTREALRVYNGPDRDAKLTALLDAACEGACVACAQLFREYIRRHGSSMDDCPVEQD